MKLPYTEVKFYPEVKSQAGLSSLRVSLKRALRLVSPKSYIVTLIPTLNKFHRHVYMRPEENSNRFEISNRFEKSFCLHGDFTTATCK